jgi:heat shock protein HslJ
MKNILNKLTFPFSVLGLFSCANVIADEDGTDNSDFTEFQERSWYLNEVRIGTTIFIINRENKPYSIYTIMFNSECFAGVGAPNHYFGSYTAKKDHNILFKKIGSTRMAPIFEMLDIKEYDYFTYIERATQWKVRKGKLELYSSKEDGTKVILVFSNNK